MTTIRIGGFCDDLLVTFQDENQARAFHRTMTEATGRLDEQTVVDTAEIFDGSVSFDAEPFDVEAFVSVAWDDEPATLPEHEILALTLAGEM